MNILLYYFLPFIVVLGILIFFHELGHFLVAKYFRVKVLKFSLGFINISAYSIIVDLTDEFKLGATGTKELHGEYL